MATYPALPFEQIQHHEKRAFLAAYAETGRVRRAATAAKVHYTSHYYWIKADPAYAAAFADAQGMVGDFLEDEAIRRAMDGWQRNVYHQGQLIGTDTVYSDTLLIFTLKGAKPEKYQDRTRLSGDANAPLEVIFKYAGHSSTPPALTP